MNVLPITLTELWMDEYPKCPVRDKTNTEESPCPVIYSWLHILVLLLPVIYNDVFLFTTYLSSWSFRVGVFERHYQQYWMPCLLAKQFNVMGRLYSSLNSFSYPSLMSKFTLSSLLTSIYLMFRHNLPYLLPLLQS